MCKHNKYKKIKLLQHYLKCLEDMIYITKKVAIFSEVCSQNHVKPVNTDEIHDLNQRIKVLKKKLKRIDQELETKNEDTY